MKNYSVRLLMHIYFYNFLNQIFWSSSLIFLKAPSTVRCVCDSHVPPLQIPTKVGASPISRLFYGADLDWLWNSRYASLRICQLTTCSLALVLLLCRVESVFNGERESSSTLICPFFRIYSVGVHIPIIIISVE